MSTPTRRLAVVDNSLLDAMLADPRVAADFAGCLGPLAAAPAAGCGSCQGRKRKAADAYDAAKLCLAGLDDTGRRLLKEALHAGQVRIVVPGSVGPTTYQF